MEATDGLALTVQVTETNMTVQQRYDLYRRNGNRLHLILRMAQL